MPSQFSLSLVKSFLLRRSQRQEHVRACASAAPNLTWCLLRISLLKSGGDPPPADALNSAFVSLLNLIVKKNIAPKKIQFLRLCDARFLRRALPSAASMRIRELASVRAEDDFYSLFLSLSFLDFYNVKRLG